MSENRSDPISSNSQSSSSSIIEVSNPLFLASSDNPSTILVSKVFDGTGFASWKRSMTLALSAKNKIGFVDGTIQKPDENSNQFETWNRVNSMVISWLLNSLSKDIAESVLFLQTACDIWNEINQRYQQANGALIYQIQKKLFSTTQGSEDFSSYFTKMKKIWDELNMIQEVPACTCGSTAKIKKYIEEQRLIQLLIDLEEKLKNSQSKLIQKDEQLQELKEQLQELKDRVNSVCLAIQRKNDEMQDARQELIHGLEMYPYCSYVGIKRMGVVDSMPFYFGCHLTKKTRKETTKNPTNLLIKCRKLVEDQNWHPFKAGSDEKEIIDEENEEMVRLKAECSEEQYHAVVTALKERNEYEINGTHPVQELWNYKEKRKASLKEGIDCILEAWKIHKQQ